MKKSLLIISVLVFGVKSLFAGLFPKVDKPVSPDASMIMLQFSVDEKGNLEKFLNFNWSMWTPVVKDEEGNIVEFRVWTAGVDDMTDLYYKENLKPGKYTLLGFNYVYTDFGKLEEYEKKKGGTELVSKNPYDDKPYRVKQFFPLEKPYAFILKPGTIMTLGHYVIKYKLKEGVSGTSDDRYRTLEDETKIMMADPEDQSLLTFVKPWASKKWKMWNARNPVQ